jgi:hypothetical protein
MGKALEILSGSATAPGTTLTGLTMASGDSLTVRNFISGKSRLLTCWPTGQTTTGFLQIRSPRMHDNVRSINFPNPVTPTYPPLWYPALQELTPQDQLIVEISGSAVAGDLMLASLLVHYDDLPGIDGNFITPDELKSKMVDLITVVNSITTTTGPNYTGAVAINATNDLMKANTPYALIGYSLSAACGAVTYRGTDTGNLRVGGPGRISLVDITRNWFIRLSNFSGIPCIPVFNSANKANTFIEAQQDENAAATVVTSFFAQLSV